MVVRSTFLFALLLLTAVANAQQPAKPTPAIPVPVIKIKNGIQFTSKVFKVTEAYLLFDDASSVPANNSVALNQRVNLVLRIKSGWAEREGKVFPGGTEQMKTADGKVFLKSVDVFKDYDEIGVTTVDAEYITLKAIINRLDTKNSSVTVSFRVWDKKGVGEITGSYRLFIR